MKLQQVKELDIRDLILDKDNPRIPKNERLKLSEDIDIIHYMWRRHALESLVESIYNNGYIPVEPLIVIKDLSSGNYIVLEGNRRLSALKLLTDDKIREQFEYKLFFDKRTDIKEVPCFIYNDRDEVDRALGMRHITGIQKWGAREKAEFMAALYRKGSDIEEIRKAVAGKINTVGPLLYAYLWVEYLNENERNEFSSFSENRLSLLALALGQTGIKNFVGLQASWRDISYNIAENDINSIIYINMRYLCSWLQDTNMIKDSRQITGRANPESLTSVLSNNDSASYLIISTDEGEPDFKGACLRANTSANAVCYKFQAISKDLYSLLTLYKQYSKDFEPEIKDKISVICDQMNTMLKDRDK